MPTRIKNFFIETRQEFKHVNWPTLPEAARLTAVVVVITLAIAVFLGASDYFFSWVLQNFIVK